MNERFAWVKSVSGDVVEFGTQSVSGEPAYMLVTPQMSTAFRDKKIVICDGPAVVGKKKKEARNDI